MFNNQNPNNGELMPNKALDLLNMLEQAVNRVKDAYIAVCKVKELLNLEPGNPQKIYDKEEEILSLKEVWVEM